MFGKKVKFKTLPIIPVKSEKERDIMLSYINLVAEKIDPALRENVLSVLTDIKFQVSQIA